MRWYPHQQRVIHEYSSCNKLALLWEMRLGKTRTVIKWAHKRLPSYKPEGRLVVAPKSTLLVWEAELHSLGLPSTILLGTPDQRISAIHAAAAARDPIRWSLTNYHGLLDLSRGAVTRGHGGPSELALLPWGLVILDESTQIRNASSRASKVARKILATAPNRAILTGTPDPEGPEDLWAQFAFLNGGSWMGYDNFWNWRDNLFFESGYSWIPRIESRKKINDAVARDAHFLRRKDVDLGGTKARRQLLVQLPPRIRKAYRETLRTWATGDKEYKHIISRDVGLQRLLNGRHEDVKLQHDAKINAAIQFCEDNFSEPIVIWFRFNAELEALAQRMLGGNRPIRMICGHTQLRDRERFCNEVRQGNGVLLIQISCGKYGLNFSWCSTFMYFSHTWEAEARAQSADRGIALSKTEPILIVDLVAKDTLDEAIVSSYYRKFRSTFEFHHHIQEWVKAHV